MANDVLEPIFGDVWGDVWEQDARPASWPDYMANRKITGLTTITPKIKCQLVSGTMPFAVQVSAEQTTYDASGNPYFDLHYEWDFGDPSSTEIFYSKMTGQYLNSNSDQITPDATHLYRSDGSYTITLTVKGINEYGQTVSASTTSILTLGDYEIFMGGATGGTFTLTVDGQTTSAIAYDATMATIVTNLEGLSTVGSGNARDTGRGTFELCGDLAGDTLTVSANFGSLTGVGTGDSAPQLIERATSATASSITVADLTGWTQRWFDPSAGTNGDGLSSASPWNDASEAFDHLSSSVNSSDKAWLWLATDSTWEIEANRIPMESVSGRVIAAYGSGAKPIIKNETGSFTFNVELFYFALPYSSGGNLTESEFKIIGCDLRGTRTSAIACVQITQTNNGTSTTPRTWFRDGLIADCDFTRTAGSGQLYRTDGTETVHNVVSWDTDYDGGAFEALATLNLNMADWVSCVGGSFKGIDGDDVFHHHVYPKVHNHWLCEWVTFKEVISANYCVNTNTQGDGACRWFVFSDCDITGTKNGIDASNLQNSYDEGDTSWIQDMIVQGCEFHDLTESGIAAWNVKSVDIRHCVFANNASLNITISRVALCDDLRVHNSRFYGELCAIRMWQDNGTFFGNKVHNTGSTIQTAIQHESDEMDITTWDADQNTLWAPNNTEILYGRDGEGYESFEDWQAYGHDANGQEADPSFDDPANGVLEYNWAIPSYDSLPEVSGDTDVGSITRLVGYDIAGNVAFDISSTNLWS